MLKNFIDKFISQSLKMLAIYYPCSLIISSLSSSSWQSSQIQILHLKLFFIVVSTILTPVICSQILDLSPTAMKTKLSQSSCVFSSETYFGMLKLKQPPFELSPYSHLGQISFLKKFIDSIFFISPFMSYLHMGTIYLMHFPVFGSMKKLAGLSNFDAFHIYMKSTHLSISQSFMRLLSYLAAAAALLLPEECDSHTLQTHDSLSQNFIANVELLTEYLLEATIEFLLPN